jgi:hypothetical protein
MPIKIITLGNDCSITFQLTDLNLRGESGIFEWYASHSFQDIIKVLSILIRENTISLTIRDDMPNDIFLADTLIRTAHYTMHTLPEIINRRWKRFQSDVETEKILFIREDSDLSTTKEQIIQFKKLIEELNPEAKYSILLLSKQKTFEKIEEEKLFHFLNDGGNILPYIEIASGYEKPYSYCSSNNDKD